MKRNKSLKFLSLGTATLTFVPILTVINCGGDNKSESDKEKVANVISTLTKNDFSNMNIKGMLSTSVTKEETYHALLSSDKIKGLTAAQRSLLKNKDLSIKAKDGALEITISNHGPNKTIIIDGFLTNADVNAKAAVQAIQSLEVSDFDRLKDANILSSNISVDQVYKTLIASTKISALKPEVRSLISQSDINVEYLDGKLEILVKSHGSTKTIIVGGFLTKASADAQNVSNAIHNLKNDNFNSLVDPKSLSTSVNINQVYTTLMKIRAIKYLSENQKDLFLLKILD